MKRAHTLPHDFSASGEQIVLSPGVAERLVACLSAAQLHEFFSGDPGLFADCFRGFKIDRRNAGRPLIRRRFCSELQHRPELANSLVRFPAAPWAPWRQALAALDEAWLLEHWRSLAEDLDDLPLLAAAMACDVRSAVARRGRRLLRRQRLWEMEGSVKNRSVPREWRALAAILEPAPPGEDAVEKRPAPAPAGPDRPGASRRLQALERRAARFAAERDAARGEIEALREAHRENARQWNEERRRLRARLDALEAENRVLAEAVEAEAARRTWEARRQLLGLAGLPVELVESDAVLAEDRPLFERVDAVLEQQARHDPVAGGYAAVREEIDRLETALERIAEFARNSLSVLPELHRIREEVRGRLEQLRALLHRHGKKEDGALARRLERDIAGATPDEQGLEALRDIEQLLQIRPFRALAGTEIVRELRRQLLARREQIEGILRERRLAVGTGPQKDEHYGEPGAWELLDFGRELERVRRSGRPITLVVDGYNVIKGVAALENVERTRGGAEARRRLEQLCGRALPAERVEIVYDGDGPLTTSEKRPGQLTVVFAGRRSTEQNADNYIVDRLPELRGEGKIWLVTADGGLRWRTRDRCAAWVDPVGFYRFLARAEPQD
ncbi:MAG: hypothetical protein GXP31_15875 [Kiritimatiellaeota bacterium]|nr:hypothetical protein [Kiritimatiellota bacterium]